MATPNMNLVLPVPNVTSGTWGTMLNTAFDLVDAHDHSTGNSVDNIQPRRVNVHSDVDYGAGFQLLNAVTAGGPDGSTTPGTVGDGYGFRVEANDSAGNDYNIAGFGGQVKDPTAGIISSSARISVARLGTDADSGGITTVLEFSGTDCSLRIFDAGVERANLTAYDLFFSSMGSQSADQVLARIIAVRAFTIPINCAESRGSVGVFPTAPATLLLKKNNVTEVTIGITVGGVFSFTNAAPVSFAAGDIITLVAQPVPDITMADIALTVVGAL